MHCALCAAVFNVQLFKYMKYILPVFWHCWLGIRKKMQPVKIEWWGVHMDICVKQGADCLHMVLLTSKQTNKHPFNGPLPGLPGWAGTRKVKPIWILLKQETVSGSGISWAICKSAPCSRQIITPTPHHSVFYRPDALPATQPTASKHWKQLTSMHPKTPSSLASFKSRLVITF